MNEASAGKDSSRFEFRHQVERTSYCYVVYAYFMQNQGLLGMSVREHIERLLRVFWLPVAYFENPNVPKLIQRQTAIAAIAELEGQAAFIRDLYGIPAPTVGIPAFLPMPHPQTGTVSQVNLSSKVAEDNVAKPLSEMDLNDYGGDIGGLD